MKRGRAPARIACRLAMIGLAVAVPLAAQAQSNELLKPSPPASGRNTATQAPSREAPAGGFLDGYADPRAVEFVERSWSALIVSVDRGLKASEPMLDVAGWYVARAATEFFNVLGLNEVAPRAVDGSPLPSPRLAETPDLAMPLLAGPPAQAAAPDTPASPPPAQPPAATADSVPKPGTDRSAAPNLAPPRLDEGFVNDTPHKLADGSVMVPKAAQRLYRLRTGAAEVTQTPVTTRLDGIVIHDPSRGGQVQATFLGRVEPPDTGMPYLGMPVTRGQILAYLRSSLPPAERATMRTEIARLTGEVAIAEKTIERLGAFFFVPFREGKIIHEKLHLQQLIKQREALLTMLTDRDALRASANGVISLVPVSAGQIVEARQTVFEIVDPNGLWVEALAYNLGSSFDVAGASALTTDGMVVPLRFVGQGLELKQHAIPLHFRIERPVANLMAGKPVIVTVQTGATQPGIVLPAESIVRTASGTDIVWEKIAPEQFAPRPVATRPLDATRVNIVAGLDADSTVVTSSARLLSQFR